MRGAITISPLLLFSFTIVLTSLSSTNFVSAASSSSSSTNDFIRKSCKATSTYPDVCVLSLRTYARSIRRSPRQLAHVALSVSASRAHDTSNFLSGVSSAVGRPGNSMMSGKSSSTASSFDDCMAAMARSAKMLRKSVRELRRLGRYRSRRFALRVANVETWVSAALTDQNACLMSLSPDGGADDVVGTGAAIRKKVEEASRMTSNALSFVNVIGSRN